MSYFHHTFLTLTFRFRARSDPTPLRHQSFTVDRSSTKHTVFTITMDQLDGACDSKPSKATSDNSNDTAQPTSTTPTSSTSPARSNSKSKSAKKRITAIFSAKKRQESKIDDTQSQTEQTDDAPLQKLSPRVTDSIPPTPKPREHKRSFKKRLSASVKRKDYSAPVVAKQKIDDTSSLPQNSLTLVAPASTQTIVPAPIPANGTVTETGGFQSALEKAGGHLPVTDAPMRAPQTRESVGLGTPGSPSREAALTSHPVSGMMLDTQSVEGEERFETPRSEWTRSGVFGGN